MTGRKGLVTLNYLVWILRFIFLAILMVSMGFVVSKYVNVRVDVSSVESVIFLERLFSSSALMFQDGVTLRVYPGVVDLKKFESKESFNDEFGVVNASRHISARVRVEGVKDVFVGKRLFEDLEPQVGGVFGGDVYDLRQDFVVSARKNDEVSEKSLSIRVLQLK